MAMLENRAVQALRRPANWIQLAKFGVIGASGYVVNLMVYASLLKGAGLHYLAAASCSFVVAASWNYWWNRHWTFREQKGHFGYQGMRFFTVSLTVFFANLGVLTLPRLAGVRRDRLAGGGDRRRHAAELPREQALVVPPLRTVAAGLVAVAVLAPAAHAAKPTPTTYGFTVTAPSTPLTKPPPTSDTARLTGEEAQQIFLAVPQGRRLARAIPAHPAVDSSFSNGTWR